MAAELTVRRPSEADAQAIAEVCNELSVKFYGSADVGPEEVRHWFSLPDAGQAVAERNGELAGICLNDWHASGDRTFGWIGVLAVRRPWRGRGLGVALLRHSFADFARRGATRVGLGVDAENTTGAVRLYERAGMRPVRRLDVFEKAL